MSKDLKELKPNQPPEEPEDVRIARRALAQGDLEHAVSHLAWALSQQPQHPAARALLDAAIARAEQPLDLVPVHRDQPNPFPVVAVRAYILQRLGRLPEALMLMTQIYQAPVPGAPFLAWLAEWLADAGQVDALDPDLLGMLAGSLTSRFSQLDPAERRLLAALALHLRRFRDAHPPATLLSAMLSSIVRKLGQLDQALELAQAAYAAQPDYLTATMLAGVLRDRGEIAAAAQTYRAALAEKPDDVYIRLDLGDMLCGAGQLAEGLAAYQEALAIEPEQPWALPSSLYCRALLEPGAGWEERLAAYAQAHPDNQRAQELLGRKR